MGSAQENSVEPSETLTIARDLIRIDTSNFGGGDAVGEEVAAEYVTDYLSRLELAPRIIQSAPTRTSVVCRVPGRDASLPPLIVHGHLDVVPADGGEWQVDPFEGVVQDGYLWGRGSVDMKNMNAMILSSLSELLRSGDRPRRDITVAFFADEENGGVLGSHYLVDHHPELFTGAQYAVSEVGGYSIEVAGSRAYLLQTGEKAMMWLNIRARGKAAHGSRLLSDNAILTLAHALLRLEAHEWRLNLTQTTEQLLREIAGIAGIEFLSADPDDLVKLTGVTSGFIASSLRTTSNPTMLRSGIKHNMVPDRAEASIDIRTLPGEEGAVLEQLREILGPDIEVDISHQDIGMEFPFEGELVDAMISSLRAEDPPARVLPYLMPAGTDNKALARLGIKGYGFVPMQLPPDFDFVSMFHGVNERIPISALSFGHRVLSHLLRSY